MKDSKSPREIAQAGFSLLEVLITTVVFSIGMLGVAGLTAVSKQAGYESTQRSTASELAFTLLEEMRHNAPGLPDYVAAGDLGGGTRGSEPMPACNDPAAPCSGAQLAAHSLWHWERMLDGGQESVGNAGSGGLLSPTACITGPAGGFAGIYTVTIVWRGVTELANPAANDCGAGSGLYGADDEFRRMVIVQSFIDPTV
jgi:type IV pilus assembly protein PilV